MLIAHIVPGYFAVRQSQPRWEESWNRKQRFLLCAVAIFSTFAPDLDVIYNTLFRGFINHSILWTHSLFPHLGMVLVWMVLYYTRRWSYLRMLVRLAAIGGVSHLVLDVISHGTPILYPFSLAMLGGLSKRVLDGGITAYITSPIFLLEPLLLTLIPIHWLLSVSKPAAPPTHTDKAKRNND